MKFAQKKDSAVSPVIGTILLVAITVILVAIIAAVVMPMVGGTSGAATVGVQVVPGTGTTYAKTVEVTFTGGDYAKITKLVATDGTNTKDVAFNTGEKNPSLGSTYHSTAFDKAELTDIKLIATINGNEQIIWQGKLTLSNS